MSYVKAITPETTVRVIEDFETRIPAWQGTLADFIAANEFTPHELDDLHVSLIEDGQHLIGGGAVPLPRSSSKSYLPDMHTNVLTELERAQMKPTDSYTGKPEHEFSDLLRRIFEYGNQTNVANAAGFKQQHLWEMLADERRNSLEATAKLYRALVQQKNPNADLVIVELARACGFVAYRAPQTDSPDARGFAEVISQVGDVSRAFADMSDEQKRAGERKAYIQQLRELGEAAFREADHQQQIDDAETRRVGLRGVR